MKVNINDREIELKYGFRALMIYEKIYGETFRPTGLAEIITFMYSVVIASDKNIVLKYDEFLDWLDEHPTVINEFTDWLGKIFGIEEFISNKEEDSKEGGEKPKKE